MPIPAWSPQLSGQIWLLFLGRLLCQVGTGFTLFYASIFFVNQIGFSATQVGLGLGAMALSGVVGRIVSGSLSDSPWGRKPTLLLSLLISAVGALTLAVSDRFTVFLLANLIAGLGQGFYWPATEAIVADLTPPTQRSEAFALNRLGDNLGLSVGVALASVLVSITHSYRLLFIFDAISFLIFFALILGFVRESRPIPLLHSNPLQSWKRVLQDRSLLIYVLANSLLTTYIAQLSSSLPLYFNNFAQIPVLLIGHLFALHGILITLTQLPAARWLSRFPPIQGLRVSSLAWMCGFGLIAMTGWAPPQAHVPLAVVSLGILALAIVFYNACASPLVVDLAPLELRGVYFAMNSLCWAVGFAVGPLVGGVMLDHPPPLAHALWLGSSMSVGIVVLILHVLERSMSVPGDPAPSS